MRTFFFILVNYLFEDVVFLVVCEREIERGRDEKRENEPVFCKGIHKLVTLHYALLPLVSVVVCVLVLVLVLGCVLVLVESTVGLLLDLSRALGL